MWVFFVVIVFWGKRSIPVDCDTVMLILLTSDAETVMLILLTSDIETMMLKLLTHNTEAVMLILLLVTTDSQYWDSGADTTDSDT